MSKKWKSIAKKNILWYYESEREENKMKKRFKLLFLVAVLALFVPNVMAAEKTASTDAELMDAFKNAVTGDTIKLTDNIEHKGGKS